MRRENARHPERWSKLRRTRPRLYPELCSTTGVQQCGLIQGYALWPQGGLYSMTIFYRTPD